MKKEKIKHEWKPFFHLLKEAKLPWGFYVLNLVIGMAMTTVYMFMPQVAGQIMAGEIFKPGLVATYIGVTIVSTLIMLPTSLFSAWVSLRTDMKLKNVVWKHIIHLPMKSLDTMPPTTLVSRVTSDTSSISYTIDYVFSLVTMVYGLVGTLIIVAGINRNMALMMFLLVPCIILANIPSHYMHNVQYRLQTATAKYTNFLAEHLGALKQIKASVAEDKEDLKNDAAAEECYKESVKMAILDVIAQPLTYGMDAVVQGIILIYGGYLLSKGVLTSESIVSLFMYASSLSISAYQFVFFWQNLKQVQGGAKTVSSIVEMEPEKMERERSFAIPDDDIHFDHVSFAYEDGRKVLNDISLSIPKGKVTAIVGPSGSGKTTVLKLLDRMYQPDEGKLMFGDKEAECIHLNEWRASFGMVPQDSPLLFGTIRDNITYGVNEDVSEEVLQSAIEAANVDEILARMPEGLKTDVGDVGSKISGGEKQRIALARMIIRDPEYLLLDEATSNLDALNESEIMSGLTKLMEGRTTVVVAHNLRTIEHADKIIFMEDGKVVDEGTHETLLEKNETYRRYVELQKK